MASVRMTKQRAQYIENQAQKTFQTANPPEKPSPELINAIYKAWDVFPPRLEFEQLLNVPKPSTVLSLAKTYSFNIASIFTKTETVTAERAHIHFTRANQRTEPVIIDIDIGAPGLKIWRDRYSYGSTCQLDTGELKLFPETYSLALVIDKELSDLITRREQLKDTETEYFSQIRQLVRHESCTTIKAYLDAGGPVAFVHPDDIQKMHVKETRAQKSERIKEAASFDPALVNKIVLTSKILGE